MYSIVPIKTFIGKEIELVTGLLICEAGKKVIEIFFSVRLNNNYSVSTDTG